MKLDKLHLSKGGDEEGKPATPPEPDARAEELIDFIEDMLGEGKWEFAYDTLTGIQDSARKSGRISLGQRRAVENIYYSKEKDEEIVWKH